MYSIGFDNEKYLTTQSAHITERIAQFAGKLYLEFGGKLFDDFHASRVLPGFAPNSKVQMLGQLKELVEIVLAISATDIEKNKVRGDHGITYDEDILRLIDAFRREDLTVGSVVITKFAGQPEAVSFQHRLERLGVPVYLHYPIADYPTNVPLIVSPEGFGKNDYIPTTRPLVVVTAPGPGSGKLAVCLSQLYHELRRGHKAGYAKFETFPVWNLPLRHPVNLAYEAATTDLSDVTLIDPYHMEAYGKTATNYNRDVDSFPVLNTIFEEIWGSSPYRSPTDMGVNMVGNCISDDKVCRAAAGQEILRRYFHALTQERTGMAVKSEIQKLELLLGAARISVSDRPVVAAARQKAEDSATPALAIELPDGTILCGRTTPLLGAASAALLNCLKFMAGIHDDVKLISPIMIEPIQRLKIGFLGNRNPRLHTDEVLIALSICTATNPTAELVLEQLPKLRNSEAHASVILSQVDINVFKKLGIRLTCDPVYDSKNLFHKK
ncbi:MAG: DUF1846 domain-containing protein [Clostridiales bacterium]|nr:DUF1846 domain-containing protein [Clostridiales bacterium]